MKKLYLHSRFALSAFVAGLAIAATPLMADGSHGNAIGEAGKASDVARTVIVTMHDNYFEPEKHVVQRRRNYSISHQERRRIRA